MSYLAWCYCEINDEHYYYAYANEMSIAEFTHKVSEKVGHSVLPGEAVGINREKDLIALRADHV